MHESIFNSAGNGVEAHDLIHFGFVACHGVETPREATPGSTRLWFVKTSRTDKNFSSAWCVSLLIRDSLLQPEVTPIHGLGPRRKARQPDSDWGK